MDYVELLVELGLLLPLYVAAFAWLAVRRVAQTVRHRHHLAELELASRVILGLGLLGFALHATVEFVMRIPATAIVGAFLAGAFLAPIHMRSGARATQPGTLDQPAERPVSA